MTLISPAAIRSGLILLFTLLSIYSYGAEKRPHIVVFLSDDHTMRDSSVYGSPDVDTPNLQRLAAEGLTFNEAYVASPSCAPSRAALLTGLYPARNGAEANHSRPRADIKKLPAYFKELGYEVVAFGKIGHYEQTTEYGFDLARHFKYHEDVAIPEAVEWLKSRKSDQPLCLFVGTNWPHVPWPKPEHSAAEQDLTLPLKHVDTPATRGARVRYREAIRRMDHDLGLMLQACQSVFDDNYFFLHTSDHGAQWPFAKWTLYEDGVRTPMIVRWPGKVEAGIRSNAMVSWIDILPTLIDVAGGTPPETLDGKSFFKVLQDPEQNHRDAVFVTHTGDGENNVYPSRMVKTADGFKLIRNLYPELEFTSHITTNEKGYWSGWMTAARTDPAQAEKVFRYQARPAEELYACHDDPQEERNLITERIHAEKAAILQKRLSDWMKSTGDQSQIQGTPRFLTQGAPQNRLIYPDLLESVRSRKEGAIVPVEEFVNPIAEGADPWVIENPHGPGYLWCFSEGNRGISIHKSDRLTSLGSKTIVWQAPATGPYSKEVWAPELHFLRDKWYIYFAASDGKNENHLTYVLESEGADPLGPYQLHGPLATGDGADGASPNIWAIDMTVLEWKDQLYAIWSGWDAPGTDRQFLYIAPMKSPTELSGVRKRICSNADYLWERVEAGTTFRGLNEGPEILKHGDRTFLVYSCGASWLPTYRLGMLELSGEDPLADGAWKKGDRPVFTGNIHTFGAGHSTFVRSPDRSEWWHVYHAKLRPEPGWQRSIFVQPMIFLKDGTPFFGDPVSAGVPIRRPSGEKPGTLEMKYDSSLKFDQLPAEFSYFGHQQFLKPGLDGLTIGKPDTQLVNSYRSGEKVILGKRVPDRVSVQIEIDFKGNPDSRDAGLLLRTSGESVGYDAQRGYVVSLIPQSSLVVFGKTDGKSWSELARQEVEFDVARPQILRVDLQGDGFRIQLNGTTVLTPRDSTYSRGQVGLRVVDSQATFRNLQIWQPDEN